MKAVSLALVALLALSGCKDYGRCLESHRESTLTPLYMPDGRGGMQLSAMIPGVTEVCDRWEFPEGKEAR